MIIKSALALLLTASFAGGAVYYGSIPGEEGKTDNGAAPTVQTPPAQADDDEKYIDKFVKPDDEPAPNEPQDESPSNDLDRLLDLEADLPDAPKTSSEVKMDSEIIMPNPAGEDTQDLPHTATKPEIDDVIEMVLAQTEMMQAQELKDQAYLDLVDFAARHKDYDQALAILDNINQTELRDTARARIAIAIAKDGEAQRAFAIIDTVEIDQLRDVMRLQVIEALIVPVQTPQ